MMSNQSLIEKTAMDKDDRLVVVGAFSQPYEVDTVQILLDSVGIESCTEGENTVAVDPFLSNAIGGIRLLVFESDAEAASEVLQNYHDEQAEQDLEKSRKCPSCQSDSIVDVHSVAIFYVLAVLTLGVFFLLFPWPRHKCSECKHEWR